MRRGLPPEFRQQAGAEIAQKVLALECYQHARTIHTYISWQEEVATHELIHLLLRAGRTVIAPRVHTSNNTLAHYALSHFDALAPGASGILEPSAEHGAVRCDDLSTIDLILVPGLAFDRPGNRLGYGGGYYDRLLAEIDAPKVGLAFAVQIVADLPIEPHDCRVDFIVTEQEVISCRAE